MERTFAIIKPDAVESKNAGKILTRIEAEGFRVVALKRHRVSRTEAESFYGEHRGKGFFSSLVAYMTSGPVYVAVLERENGVAHWRTVMGATDPAKADAGTIRKEFGQSIERNAAHGSANGADAARVFLRQFAGGDTGIDHALPDARLGSEGPHGGQRMAHVRPYEDHHRRCAARIRDERREP